jgi:hypothetical protein
VVIAPNWLGDAVMSLARLATCAAFWERRCRRGAPVGRALFEMVAGVDDVVTLEAGRAALRTNAGALAQADSIPRSCFQLFDPRTVARGIAERWGYAPIGGRAG